MRQHLLGIASLLLGAAVGLADDSGVLPAVEIRLKEEVVEQPRPLPPVAESIAPANCPTCLPEPPCKFLPEPCKCGCTASEPNAPCGCNPTPRFWFNAQYMLWTVSNGPLAAPIFTQGPLTAGGVARAPGVRTIYGGDEIDSDAFNGARAEFGYWFNTCQTLGIDVRGFVLERGSDGFQATSGANDPIAISRSFVNALNGDESAIFMTLPPIVSGSVFANASTRLWGANSDLIVNLRDRSTYRLDALVGFEYLDLYETLDVGSVTQLPIGGASIAIQDSFRTRNQFYGTDLGVRGTAKRGRFDCSAAFKVGLGVTHEVLEISGQTDLNLPGGAPTTVPGGFLAVESNSGRFVRDRFACVPEANFQIGYRICKQCHAFVAYDLLYWSNVMRPGDQVDHTINPLQVPILTGGNPIPVAALNSPVRPQAPATATDLFAQGVSFGVGVTY